MGTITDKLNATLASKNAIRNAITEKIGEDAGEVMSTYAEKIKAIQSNPKWCRTRIRINQNITDPSTMITNVFDDGAIGMIRANSHRYVCKLVDGVLEAKQLQDGNGTLYLDGTTADLTGGEGDVMMKLPKFRYYYKSDSNGGYFIDLIYGEIDYPEFSGYYTWEGDDFIGVYEASLVNENLYSLSGKTCVDGVSQKNLVTYGKNKGDGFSIIKYDHHSVMMMLYLAFYKNTNSQATCGAGTNAIKTTGQTSVLGMEDTSAEVNGNLQSINFWGLENWWGNQFEWMCDVKATTMYIYITRNNGQMSYYSIPQSSGYISNISFSSNYIIPSSSSGSNTTSFCDYFGASSKAYTMVMRSYWQNDVRGGAFGLNAEYDENTIVSRTGTRIAYKGEYRIIE